MRSVIGLTNMILFSAVLLGIGSVSAQQAFAGQQCVSFASGDWNNSDNWTGCIEPTPSINDEVVQIRHDITIMGNEDVVELNVHETGTLFIDCDASLTITIVGGFSREDITNHGDFTSSGNDFLLLSSTFFNSGTFSGVVEQGGSIVEISTICSQPIGGIVGSLDTTSLLIAGAQANMGWWSLALVGMVAAGAAITYKLKSKKTEQ